MIGQILISNHDDNNGCKDLFWKKCKPLVSGYQILSLFETYSQVPAPTYIGCLLVQNNVAQQTDTSVYTNNVAQQTIL